MLPVVNDPSAPWIVCLGNTHRKAAAIAPVLSMLTDMIIPTMYGHDRNKSFLVLDELPTMILPQLSKNTYHG